VRVKSYKQAVQLARCAGEDAANRRMRKAGRKAWSEADHDHAVRVTEDFLVKLGFDIPGWIATAGFPRNEPEDTVFTGKPATKAKRRAAPVLPIQLSFAFA
jgi:hypothetical protein